MRSFSRALILILTLVAASHAAAQPSPLPTPLVPDLTQSESLVRVERWINRQFRAIEAARIAGDCPARDRRLGALQVWIAVVISENTRTGGRFARSTFEEYLGRLAMAWRRPCPPVPPPPPPPPPLPPESGFGPFDPFGMLEPPTDATPPTGTPSPEPDAPPPESILDMFEEGDGLEGVYIPPRGVDPAAPPEPK